MVLAVRCARVSCVRMRMHFIEHVQRRQLTAAEHGDSDQGEDDEMFDQGVHGYRKPAPNRAVKCGVVAIPYGARHLSDMNVPDDRGQKEQEDRLCVDL